MSGKRKIILSLSAVCLAAAVLVIIISQSIHEKVRISLVGDILFSRGVKHAIDEHSAQYLFDGVKDSLNLSDIVLGNLECTLTEEGIPALKSGSLLFKADLGYAKTLRDAGFTIMDLANNHSMDYGSEGISSTISALMENGISVSGAGADKADANKPVFIEKEGTTFGFLCYSDFPADGYFPFNDRWDVAFVDRKTISTHVLNAKKDCDILIVSFHWGSEFSHEFDSLQQELAHIAADSGADIIVGHHPHVLQGIEKYNDSFIFYSLGNFVFDKLEPQGTEETIICDIKYDGNNIEEIILTPVKIKNCRPEQAEGDQAEKILSQIVRLSNGCNTVICIKNGKGYIQP